MGDVEVSCGCCGQEQCRSCWADGEDALCGTCRGRAWDDVAPEESVVPIGLLVGDEDEAATDGAPLPKLMLSWSA